MAKPLDSKEIFITQELAIFKMLEIKALIQLLFEKGIISEEEFIAKFKKLDREMKEKRGKIACVLSFEMRCRVFGEQNQKTQNWFGGEDA